MNHQTALLPNPAALVHLSSHLSLLHARDPTLFPGCPRTDDLAILGLNDPPPGSPLSAQDLTDLRKLREDLIRICTQAQARNVRVIVDAEHSWFQVRSASCCPLDTLRSTFALQPAVDSISLALMREFNREPSSLTNRLLRLFSRAAELGPPPLIYVTCQAYLRR